MLITVNCQRFMTFLHPFVSLGIAQMLDLCINSTVLQYFHWLILTSLSVHLY